MAIIFTGTTITAVNHTTTNIDTVVHTGTTVFTSAPPNHIWVLIHIDSSEPATDLGMIESSSTESYWETELTLQWPPNNYAAGVTAGIGNGYDLFHVYQIQEG